MIDQYLKALAVQRKDLLNQLELTTAYYNLVPPGYNNNIIWNIGHMQVVSESYLYRNAPFTAPAHGFDVKQFKRGTRPEYPLSSETITEIRTAMLDAVSVFKEKCIATDKLKEEHNSSGDLFQSIISESSMQFVLFHDKMHSDTIAQMLQYISRVGR